MSTTIKDNGDSGYAEVGSWTANTAGYQGDDRFIAAGAGSNNATWEFTGLSAGVAYKLAITWSFNAGFATNTPYRILDSDGTTVLASGTLNQTKLPGDFADSSW